MLSRRYRTLWISDVHLGTRHAKAEALLRFLDQSEADVIYLVGDIVDGWRLRRSWYWTEAANDVVQALLRKAREGTRVVYIPGNHDEFARPYAGHRFGGIAVQSEALHETADGRRLLVLHGDEFDGIVRHMRGLALLGAGAYEAALVLNRWLNAARQRMGHPYWSLSAYLKGKTKRAVQFVDGFERLLATEAKQRGVDGVVCGHIHKAELRAIGPILYANTGDWVESCTALTESWSGRLEIVRWPAHDAPPERLRPTRPAIPLQLGRHGLLTPTLG